MTIHPEEPRERPHAIQRGLPRPFWIGGVAAAIASGVFLGLATQSDRGSISAAKAEAAASPLQVELAGLPKAPQPVAGKLDVRPSGSAPAELPARPPQIQPREPDLLGHQTPPSAEDDGAEEIDRPAAEPLRLEPPPPEDEPLEDY